MAGCEHDAPANSRESSSVRCDCVAPLRHTVALGSTFDRASPARRAAPREGLHDRVQPRKCAHVVRSQLAATWSKWTIRCRARAAPACAREDEVDFEPPLVDGQHHEEHQRAQGCLLTCSGKITCSDDMRDVRVRQRRCSPTSVCVRRKLRDEPSRSVSVVITLPRSEQHNVLTGVTCVGISVRGMFVRPPRRATSRRAPAIPQNRRTVSHS